MTRRLATLLASTWIFRHLMSPGGGVYLAHNKTGGLIRSADPSSQEWNTPC
jgi:hypothetical protein